MRDDHDGGEGEVFEGMAAFRHPDPGIRSMALQSQAFHWYMLQIRSGLTGADVLAMAEMLCASLRRTVPKADQAEANKAVADFNDREQRASDTQRALRLVEN